MNYFEKFFDIIFPKGCINCGKYGVWLCDRCKNVFQNNLPECFYCRRISSGCKSHVACHDRPNLKSVQIIWQYDKIAHRLMGAYKYDGIRELSQEIVDLTQERFNKYILGIAENFILTVIPLSKHRKKERGFNQADLIAKGYIGKDLKYLPELLVRNFDNENQAHLSKELRLLNVENIFEINQSLVETIDKTLPVIIFDDVVTTGSTLNAAAECLHKEGFTSIYGFALFRGKPRFGDNVQLTTHN